MKNEGKEEEDGRRGGREERKIGRRRGGGGGGGVREQCGRWVARDRQQVGRRGWTRTRGRTGDDLSFIFLFLKF